MCSSCTRWTALFWPNCKYIAETHLKELRIYLAFSCDKSSNVHNEFSGGVYNNNTPAQVCHTRTSRARVVCGPLVQYWIWGNAEIQTNNLENHKHRFPPRGVGLQDMLYWFLHVWYLDINEKILFLRTNTWYDN